MPEPTPKTLDITPTWSAIMPALIALLEDGTGAGHAAAREELLRLAAALDRAPPLGDEDRDELERLRKMDDRIDAFCVRHRWGHCTTEVEFLAQVESLIRPVRPGQNESDNAPGN